ncbi:hypothetical protein TorRG33x02_095210 [Trema orientale]|uniref:Uncharacterized protein n=1 Tax=Trema orientale TaxID=63057 RepID=A0A2P5FAC1_TREOI|nr:hypothetical protein TorRG33x02_095210 [Trema orientale]
MSSPNTLKSDLDILKYLLMEIKLGGDVSEFIPIVVELSWRVCVGDGGSGGAEGSAKNAVKVEEVS